MLNVPLSDATFRELRDFIYTKSGIFISDTKKYLIENRLSRILHERSLSSFEDYYSILKVSSNGNELIRLFDAITTNETYFFRELDQLKVFVNDLVPNILSSKTSQPVKIWSAACSTGEEPYSIAMMLLEKGLSNKQFEIYASDISEGVLSSAKAAVYNSYSVRNVPDNHMKKYFSSNGSTFTLNPQIKQYVKFMKINLFDDKNVKLIHNADVIFCRNVLIYFDIKSKQKVASYLYDRLTPRGYLFIGASESLHNITRAFRPNVLNKIIAYQKV